MNRDVIKSKLDSAWNHYKAGQNAETVRLCREVVQADPKHGEAWYILGTALFGLNQLREAEDALVRAVSERPNLISAQSILGIVLKSQGRVADALGPFERAVALDPEHGDAQNNLGNTYRELGRVREAEACYREAVRLMPEHPMALGSLVHLLASQNRRAEEVDVLRQVVQLRPDYLNARLHLGAVLTQTGRFEEAVEVLREGIARTPESAEAHNTLGAALAGLKRWDEALDHYGRALFFKPDFAQAYSNQAIALGSIGRHEESLDSFRQALRLAPDSPDTYSTRGVFLLRLGRYEEALDSFEQALRLSPDYPPALTNRSAIWLIHGDFLRGWKEHESRRHVPAFKLPAYQQARWQGEPLEGRTILLHWEQGVGDTLQFIRYAPLVKARGGRVVVECQRPLVRLLETCNGIDCLVPRGDPLPAFDTYAALMSLPAIFQTTLETIPASVPYLAADAARVDLWAQRLKRNKGLLVGIAWQGNRDHQRDRDRSFPLALFEKLARIDGVRLISLQKGDGVEQLRALDGRFPVLDLGEDVDPNREMMHDTPAVMMNLDLVISPDTAIAHLAGALGIPFWVCVTHVPDFRWLLEREDSPWYPTARVFRQSRPGCWEDVFERMAEVLAKMSSTHNR